MRCSSTQVRIDLKEDTPLNLSISLFTYTCYGKAESQSTKLLLRKGQVNRPVGELCQQMIRVGYIWTRMHFEVNNYIMIKPRPYYTIMRGRAHTARMLSSFFNHQNLTPRWQWDHNEKWGYYYNASDKYTGLIGYVR